MIVKPVYGVIIELYNCGLWSTSAADDAVADDNRGSLKLSSKEMLCIFIVSFLQQ